MRLRFPSSFATTPFTVCFALLAAAYAVYPWLPTANHVQETWYDVVGVGALALAFAGLLRHRPAQRRAWLLVLSGYGLWVVADVIATVEEALIPDVYPAPSDLPYLAAYVLLGAGVLGFVAGRRDLAALLDSAIVTAGTAVLLGVFLVAPLTAATDVSTPVKLVGAAYPLGDLFVLGMLARAIASPIARTTSFRLLVASLGLTLVGDVAWNLQVARTGETGTTTGQDMLYLSGYVVLAAAACVPSMRELATPSPARIDPAHLTNWKLGALSAGLALPGLTLLIDGAAGGGVRWAPIGAGMMLLALLVLFRMVGLLRVLQQQSERLAAQAHTDPLTGAPNRRTWDADLAAACTEAEAPFAVALIDLDRFKVYNDTHGHPAGDTLLREAVATWTRLLPEGALLARYGGEEFAVLFPDLDAAAAVGPLQAMRRATPDGQTFSAGLADRCPGDSPDTVTAAADQALYEAKRAGRDRVVVAGAGNPDPCPLPEVTMVTQPVVDVGTGVVTGHEALARFPGQDGVGIEEVFRRAWADGTGDLLELAALRAALALPDRPEGQDLYVNVSARTLASRRFRDGLPRDLTGVVLELGERTDDVPLDTLTPVLEELRDRGARLALDDVGAGADEFARLATLRPDVVKVDRSLVHGCATDPGRTAVLSALVTYAAEAGSVVCGEGVETAADLAHLRLLGIPLAQGYLLARPRPGWTTAVLAPLTTPRRTQPTR